MIELKAQAPVGERAASPRWLLCGFWISLIIALAAVVRRLVALTTPPHGATSPAAELDSAFSSHAALTLLHIIPAAIFVILAACLLLRSPTPSSLERFFFAFGLVTGVTAYLMSSFAVGGSIEIAAVLVFNTYFLFSLACAYLFWVRGDSEHKRQWMIRAVGILLGIATTRPVMGVFFATSKLTHLGPHEFFGIAFFIGFSINVAVTELWLRSKTRKAALKLGT